MTEHISHIERAWRDSILWIGGNLFEIALAAAAGFALVIVLSAIRSLGVRACRNDRFGTGWPGIVGRVIAATRLWFMIALAAKLVAAMTAPPTTVAQIATMLFTIAAAFEAALWGRTLVLGIVERRAGIEPDNQTLGSAMGLIRVLVTVALFAIAVVLILDNLGVNVTGLVAGLGIGGIAIGLAAQGIFSDLFAALSIIFDKPFRVGDIVNWDQMTGVVEKIGLKTTRFRSMTGEQVVVSNAKLLDRDLRNMTMLEHRRFTLPFGLIYQTSPETLRAIPDMVAGMVNEVPDCAYVRCGMTGLGASSLDFELVFDIQTRDPGHAVERRSEVCVALVTLFREREIGFAYPTQTTFTAAPDGRMVMPYAVVK